VGGHERDAAGGERAAGRQTATASGSGDTLADTRYWRTGWQPDPARLPVRLPSCSSWNLDGRHREHRRGMPAQKGILTSTKNRQRQISMLITAPVTERPRPEPSGAGEQDAHGDGDDERLRDVDAVRFPLSLIGDGVR
jgi:hypothetical protein